MRIAITGHRDLYGATAALIDAALRHEIRRLGEGRPLVGGGTSCPLLLPGECHPFG